MGWVGTDWNDHDRSMYRRKSPPLHPLRLSIEGTDEEGGSETRPPIPTPPH